MQAASVLVPGPPLVMIHMVSKILKASMALKRMTTANRGLINGQVICLKVIHPEAPSMGRRLEGFLGEG